MATVDYFMKIDGIKGESGDSKHKDEIDVLSGSWGETQQGASASGGGGGAGKVAMQDFHFTKRVDKASAPLLLACASGQHIKTVDLVCRNRDQTGRFDGTLNGGSRKACRHRERDLGRLASLYDLRRRQGE